MDGKKERRQGAKPVVVASPAKDAGTKTAAALHFQPHRAAATGGTHKHKDVK